MTTMQELSTDLDGASLREAFARHPSGVVAVCAEVDGVALCLIASSFVPVSLDPPLVSFCVQWTSTTWPVLSGAARLGVSVLGESHAAVVRQLSGPGETRFDGVGTTTMADGAVFLDDSALWLSCSLESVLPAGDHGIVVLRLHGRSVHPQVQPLVFAGAGFHRLAEVTS